MVFLLKYPLDRSKIFEKDYFSTLLEYKPKINLIASQEVRKETGKVYNFVKNRLSRYDDYIDENDPMADPSRFQIIYSDFGEEGEVCNVTDVENFLFERNLEEYKKENLPSAEEFREIVIPLYNAMREDLGSNL